MTLRGAQPIPIGVPLARRPRPPLAAVVPGIDLVALLTVVAISGFRPPAVVLAGIAFAILLGATPRSFRINPRLSDDTGLLLGSVAGAATVALALTALRGYPLPHVAHLTRIGAQALIAAVLVVLGRGLSYALLRRARSRGMASERTVIIGDGEVAADLADILVRHPEFGLRPVGFLGRLEPRGPELPLLGDPQDLEDVVTGYDIRRVLVAFGGNGDRQLATLLRATEHLPVEVHAVPRFFELSATLRGRNVDDLWGIPLVHLRRPAIRPAAFALKRALDVLLASAALIMTVPLLLAIAVAVRCTSKGPILFRQRRVGLHGRTFDILKFRTMEVNDDSDITWFDAGDGRVTTVGGLIRRCSLDELPQLVNVLRGDMSLVGPRPERPHYVAEFNATIPRYGDRHRVPCGITGWAQVHGRSRGVESIPERARFDNAYIENWSIWRDVSIMIRTVGMLFKGDRP